MQVIQAGSTASGPRARAGGKAAGVTFIELLVTIGLLSVLLVAALPSFAEAMRSQRLASGANDLHADLAYARAEAVKRRRMVGVYAVDGDFAQGWTVRVDGEPPDDEPSDGDVLRRHAPLTDVDHVLASADRYVLAPHGGLVPPRSVNTTFCEEAERGADGVHARHVNVLPSGRVETRRGTPVAVTCP